MLEANHSSPNSPFTPAAGEIALITTLSKSLAYRAGFSPDDVLDFCQQVHLTFLESDYAALRQFNGRSSLKTYLNVVIKRLLLDRQRHLLGRWRPSSLAIRGGPAAITLERLVNRDSYTVQEAIEVLVSRSGGLSRREISQMAAKLPLRRSSQRFDMREPDEAAIPFIDPIAAREDWQRERRAARTVAAAARRLSAQDRNLLRLRYVNGMRVPQVADKVGLEAGKVYRRYREILTALRAEVGDSMSHSTC